MANGVYVGAKRLPFDEKDIKNLKNNYAKGQKDNILKNLKEANISVEAYNLATDILEFLLSFDRDRIMDNLGTFFWAFSYKSSEPDRLVLSRMLDGSNSKGDYLILFGLDAIYTNMGKPKLDVVIKGKGFKQYKSSAKQANEYGAKFKRLLEILDKDSYEFLEGLEVDDSDPSKFIFNNYSISKSAIPTLVELSAKPEESKNAPKEVAKPKSKHTKAKRKAKSESLSVALSSVSDLGSVNSTVSEILKVKETGFKRVKPKKPIDTSKLGSKQKKAPLDNGVSPKPVEDKKPVAKKPAEKKQAEKKPVAKGIPYNSRGKDITLTKLGFNLKHKDGKTPIDEAARQQLGYFDQVISPYYHFLVRTVDYISEKAEIPKSKLVGLRYDVKPSKHKVTFTTKVADYNITIEYGVLDDKDGIKFSVNGKVLGTNYPSLCNHVRDITLHTDKKIINLSKVAYSNSKNLIFLG